MKRPGCSVSARRKNYETTISLGKQPGQPERIYLGLFPTEDDGHKAVDTAIKLLKLDRPLKFSGEVPTTIWNKVFDRLTVKKVLSVPYQEKHGDMFRFAPRKAILTHACNAQGRWGRGIAYTMQKRFPSAYANYAKYCYGHSGHDPKKCGTSYIAMDSKLIGCLLTSWHWDPHDDEETILRHTATSVRELIEQVSVKYPDYEIHSCKINSGLFKVDWERTQAIIKTAMIDTKCKIPWVVWNYTPRY